MIKAPTKQLSQLQNVINQLNLLERNHFVALTDKKEDVAAHSLTVAMFAWYLHQFTNSQLNLLKIQQYAIIHDFVEIHAGDTNTFASKNERASKELREQAAVKKFIVEFEDFTHMTDVIAAYQDMEDAEARFVWTADKIQALIHGQNDNWRAYYMLPVTNEMFDKKMDELSSKALPELRPLFDAVVSWCKETYHYQES